MYSFHSCAEASVLLSKVEWGGGASGAVNFVSHFSYFSLLPKSPSP